MSEPLPTEGPVARMSRLLSLACMWLAGIGLCAMTAIILWQVFARYVLNSSPSWSEQAALYILIWTILFGGAAGVRENFHIRMTAFQDAIGKHRVIPLIVAHLITGAIGVFLVIYGANLVVKLWDFTIPTLGVPRGSAMLPMPIAGVLITGFVLEHLVAIFRGREVTPSWP